ncbi:hypothetical protein HDZ31DRAFT_48691 [Schizophyllum fasciatum]
MSATSTPNDSPTTVQPLHNPSQAATVVLPQAPLGNVLNQAPGMGAKALLAKRMPKAQNASYVSPTDNMMTPCTQKLNAAKKKQFNRAKPTQLFAAPQQQQESDEEDEDEVTAPTSELKDAKMDDDENPF